MPSELQILVHHFSESCPGPFTSVSAIISTLRLYPSINHDLLLLIFGDMGNSPQLIFIFFTNTRYASRASICVGNVLLRFIHIFRYLSEPKSFRAAYHCASDVCFRTMARRRPPNPVTPLACFRQAAFRSDISVLSSAGSPVDERTLDGLFERTGFEGASFGDATFGEVVFGEAVFGDEVFEDEGFDADVFVVDVFEEGAFGGDVSWDVVFEDVGFGIFVFGDAVFGDAIFGDAILGDATFEDAIFRDSILGRAIFGDSIFDGGSFFEGVVGEGAVVTFEGANFAVTIFEGLAGATTGGGATGSLVGVCEDWN